MDDAPISHGGDLAWADAEFGAPDQPWLDLSTGINPFPYPVGDIGHAAYVRLPDTRAEAVLRTAAASCYGVVDPDRIVVVPGAQMAIQILPRLRPPGRVSVIGPTYGEHARAWKAAGHTVITVSDTIGMEYSDVAVVTNPNNPDGRCFATDFLARRAADLAGHGGWLVVDESFADVQPDVSLAARGDLSGCIVLRSFGKFFGLPGLRLGFALAPPHLAARIRTAIGPWPVNGPALQIGAGAFADSAWIDATRVRLDHAAAELDALLTGAGLSVVGGTSLFRLVKDERAAEICAWLGHAGILVRFFPGQPDWVRFGLPGNPRDADRLATALSAWRAEAGG